jgi:hypothetical protein
LVPTILRLASLAQNVGILKITATHRQRSWVIFEEAGIFTRHALWRATTELRPHSNLPYFKPFFCDSDVSCNKNYEISPIPNCEGTTRTGQKQVPRLRASLSEIQTNNKEREYSEPPPRPFLKCLPQEETRRWYVSARIGRDENANEIFLNLCDHSPGM